MSEINKQLCLDIANAVEAEPERLFQEEWATLLEYPNGECRTMFCVAGWAVHLSDPEDILWEVDEGWSKTWKANETKAVWSETLVEKAARLLGLRRGDANRLFDRTWDGHRFGPPRKRPSAGDVAWVLRYLAEHGELPYFPDGHPDFEGDTARNGHPDFICEEEAT